MIPAILRVPGEWSSSTTFPAMPLPGDLVSTPSEHVVERILWEYDSKGHACYLVVILAKLVPFGDAGDDC